MTANAVARRPEPPWPIETWPPLSGKAEPSPRDPFYLPPADWANTTPGTPLRRRRVRVSLFGVVPLRLQAWQLLYRSTDLHGAPETTVTTVLVPRAATQESPVIAYQVAIDAVTPLRFPSYTLLPGSFGLNQTQNELLLMVAALAKGWIVTVSDHEGPHGLFMMARQPGYNVLDGVRATLAAAGEDGIPALPADAPVGLWGYSGGGTASAWAAELADDYAPELNIVGALLGGPAALPASLVPYYSGRMLSGLIIPVFAALMRAHPSARGFLQQHLNRKGLRIVEKAEHISVAECVLRWPFKNFNKIIDRPLEELMAEPEIADLTDEMELGQRAPQLPVYLYHSVHDQFLPIAASDQLAERYIAGGTHVTYRRDRLGEHISLAVSGVSDALEWLAERVARMPLPAGPDVRTVVSTSATPRALWGVLPWLAGIVKLLIGRL